MQKTLVFAVALLFATASSAFGETHVQTHRILDRATAEKAFERLTQNAQKGLLAENAVAQSKFQAIDDLHFNIGGGTDSDTGSEAPVGVIPITNGMKIWFERVDGKLVDPSVYRFSPKEEFFVHIEAAVPVFVYLYQHFPHQEGKAPVQVHPDQRFPSSFRILNPAESTKLPIRFAMDDNYEAEYMSIVVARADWDELIGLIPGAARAAVDSANADSPERRETIARDIAGITGRPVQERFAERSIQDGWIVEEPIRVGGIHDPWKDVKPEPPVVVLLDRSNTEEPSSPFPGVQTVQVSFKSVSLPGDGISNEIRDVANYLFTNTGDGHLQIVLNKVEPLAP